MKCQINTLEYHFKIFLVINNLAIKNMKVIEITKEMMSLYELWKGYDEKKEIGSLLAKMPRPKVTHFRCSKSLWVSVCISLYFVSLTCLYYHASILFVFSVYV